MQNRKPIFFTSDWHIGHLNVLKLSNRPFKDLDHMHRVLVNNYNACVPDNGVCYFLGDAGLCKAETMSEVLGKLNGTKVLILGNHDKGSEAMYKLGFDVVLYGATIQVNHNRITMSHCPLLGVYREDTSGMRGSDGTENWHGESREKRARFTRPNNGQFHLHGHIHSPNGGRSQRVSGRQLDVGIDANNYHPLSLSSIESWVAKTIKNEKYQEKITKG